MDPCNYQRLMNLVTAAIAAVVAAIVLAGIFAAAPHIGL